MPKTSANAERGMDGVEKAAILLIALGPEKSAQIFKHLKEEEIEQLTLEIANTSSVSPQTKEQVLNEFYEVCLAPNVAVVLHSSILLRVVSHMPKSFLKKHLEKIRQEMLLESLQRVCRFVHLSLSEKQILHSFLTLYRMSILRL